MRVRIVLTQGGCVEGALSPVDADTVERILKRAQGFGEAASPMPDWVVVDQDSGRPALVHLPSIAVLEVG